MKKTLRLVVKIAGLLAVYMVMQALFQTLATLLMISLSDLPADTVNFIYDAEYLNNHPVVQDCMTDAIALSTLLSTVAMLLFIHFTGYYKLRRGLWRSLAPKPLLISTLLVFTSIFTLNIFVQWFPLENNLNDVFNGLSHNWLGILGLAVLAPLLEEILFRGAVQGLLMRFFGRPWPAIVIAALVFGIAHWNPVQTVYATIFGIVLGWIYYRTGTLLSVIVGHVLNNSMAVMTTVWVDGNVDEEAVEAVAGASYSIASYSMAGFVIFGLLSVFLAIKLNKSLPPVEKLVEEK